MPPELDAEGSLSLRLAMVGARHAHFGVLLLGFLTLLLAYISNAVLPMGVSIACTAITLIVLAVSLRRPAQSGPPRAAIPVPAPAAARSLSESWGHLPIPARPAPGICDRLPEEVGRRPHFSDRLPGVFRHPRGDRFNWNAEVTSAEVALYGIVTVGLLTLLMAYFMASLADGWILLGASVACTVVAVACGSRNPQLGVGLIGLLTLAIAYGMESIVLFSFSAASTVVVLISLRMAGCERRRAAGSVGGLDWNPDLSYPEMAQFLAVLAGLLALTTAYVLDSPAALAVSLAGSFLVVMGMLRHLQLGVVMVGFAALGAAWWFGSVTAGAASIACSLAVVTSLTRDHGRRRARERDAQSLRATESERMTWSEALAVAAAQPAADAPDAAGPVAPAEVVIVPSLKVLDKAVTGRPGSLTAALRLDDEDEPSARASASGRRGSAGTPSSRRSPAARPVGGTSAAPPSTARKSRPAASSGTGSGTATQAEKAPSPRRASSPKRPASKGRAARSAADESTPAPAVDAPATPPSGRRGRPPSRDTRNTG